MTVWLCQNLLLAALQAGLTGAGRGGWLHGKASAGDVAFVITTFLIMSGYLRNMGDNIRMLQRGLADVEDVARFAQTAPAGAGRARRAGLPPELGEIVCENVTFRYKSADRPIYEDFSLRIAPGERLALVGPTGVGQVDLRQAAPAALRPAGRPHPDRRPGHRRW